jgi:hypothetical protein
MSLLNAGTVYYEPSMNICPKCGRVIYEELYAGTASPDLCTCEPVRTIIVRGIVHHHIRQPGYQGGSVWPGEVLGQ